MERNSTHLAGEYFVAAELYRRGFSVGMTIGNAKAIDLMAYKDHRAIAVQVKAIRDKKSAGWPITPDKLDKGAIYVFVNLNGTASPDYYILTSGEASEHIKMYTTRGIINLGVLKKEDYLNRWDKLDKEQSLLPEL